MPLERVATQPLRLDSWAPLHVSGADAETFLQGQLSADLRALTPERASWASYNSPKGRMLAVMLMVRSVDAIELWMPTSLLEAIAKRLRMFVMRSKVAIERRPNHTALALFGEGAPAWLASKGLPCPIDQMSVGVGGELRVLRAAGNIPRFLLIGTIESLPTADSSAETADTTWRAADIEAGIPVVYPATQDRWVAQMANVDLIGGISFEKGCYTGQEVVARLHYLGNLKKRLFRVEGAGAAPEPGTAIRDMSGDGQSVGDTVDAVASGDGFIATAVLQIGAFRSPTLGLDRETDASIRLARPFDYPGVADYSSK